MIISATRVQRSMFVLSTCIASWELIHVLTSPLSLIVQYVPDDAFYYLELSRNLASIGKSSFDGGQTITTGYHVLWAWLCEVIARICHLDRPAQLHGMILLSGLLAIGTFVTVGIRSWTRSLPMLTVVALMLTSTSFLANSVSAMEFSLTITVSVAFVFLLARCDTKADSRLVPASLFLLGVLGSLSRSDFGGETAAYFAAALALWLVWRDKTYCLPALSGLMGAVAGLGFIFWRNHYLTGHYLQSSARMKAMWTTASGRSPFPFFLVLLRTVFYAPYSKPWKVIRSIKTMNHSGNPVSGHHFVALAVTFVLFALLSTFLVVWSRLALAGNDEAAPRVSRGRARFFLMAASLMILLYAVVDMFDSVGVQAWYTSQTLVAVGTLLYFMLRRLAMDRRAHGLYFIVALFGCANLVIFALSKPIDAAQESIPVLSASIKNAVGNAKIGISDAGIFNYVYGGDVINLDGLVNDEIVGYAPDHLPCYLADKKILYFMGFGLSSESAFNLEPITDYSTPVDVPVPGHTPVTIYRIDNARVKALPACKHR